MGRDVASGDLYDHARYVGGRLGRFKGADQLGGTPKIRRAGTAMRMHETTR